MRALSKLSSSADAERQAAMLAIANREHFARVVAFARARDLLPQLTERLWYLHMYRVQRDRYDAAPAPAVQDWTTFPAEWIPYAVAGDTTVTLGYDSAPASLSVDWTGPFSMCGAMVYHGTQDGWHAQSGMHRPTFTCTLASARELAENPWGIHT